MYRNRSPHQIIESWQDNVEQNAEAGTAPVLELGASNLPVDGIPAYLALRRWHAQRTDVSKPVIVGGGLGPLWMATMLRPLLRHPEPHAPEPEVLFGGATETEYLMTVAELHAARDRHDPAGGAHAAIPVSYFVPESQPGMSVSWDSLPFLALDWQPQVPGVEAQDNGDAPEEDLVEDPLRDWLAWAGMLFALFLVLLAVLL